MGKIVSLTIFVLIVRFWEIDGRPQQTKPGCWHDGKRYQEGQTINTTEPCLRCRCDDGSLRCRLRVCPRLPSPVPPGCATRKPRDNACCDELVCADSHERNVTVKRVSAKDPRRHEDGCLHEGVRYGPGSAMMGSRRCEYCYCISGSRRCLRPRCLLPLAGCIPLYAPDSCCPVAYNCNNSANTLPSFGSSSSSSKSGCRVGNRSYDEGEMVRDIGWKGICDNCFCAMGGVRCVPLACAPPLQGCTPIVREGHCCPSTYNCSGTIEVKATQNYASYAFISKDYAKFRKETNFLSIKDHRNHEITGNSTVEGRGHKNPRQPTKSSSTSPKNVNDSATSNSTTSNSINVRENSTSLKISSEIVEMKNFTVTLENTTVMTRSQDNETMDNEIPTENLNIDKFSTNDDTTFSIDWTMINETTEIPTTTESLTSLESSNHPTTTVTSEESLDLTNSIVNRENFSENSVSTLETWTIRTNDETTLDYTSIDDYTTLIHDEDDERTSTISGISDIPKIIEPKSVERETSTRRNVAESTTKFWKIDEHKDDDDDHRTKNDALQNLGIGESSVISIKGPVTGSPTTVLMPDNMFVINVTLRTNVSVGHVQDTVTINPVRSIPPDIEAIINITNRKKGEDYDYDYSQPTLPPSLPNVRIIPFVAADALVKQSDEVSSQVTNYPLGSVGLQPQELGPTVTSGTVENFYDTVTRKNRFSPPIETEGGFLPREPLYYDPPYRPTDHNLEIHTGVTLVPADITNSHRKNDELAGICIFENRNYRHGDILPSSGHCIICICYYGEVACSDEKCSPLKIGCSRLENDKICCGKIICVDANESPTVVLDRADAIAPSPREPLPSLDGMASPDPFRDVIKTKPAPDLPSLIEDMIPYLVERRTTKPSTTLTTPMTTTSPNRKFESSTTHVQPFNSEYSVKSVDQNETGLNQENQNNLGTKIPTIDSLKLATSLDQRGNETLTLPETIRISDDISDRIPVQQQNEDESSIFSFDSVFDLLFSENTDTRVTTEATESSSKMTTNISSNLKSESLPPIVSKNLSINLSPEISSNSSLSRIIPNRPPGINSNVTFNLSNEPPTSGQFLDHTRQDDKKPFNDDTSESLTTIAKRLSTASNTGTTERINAQEDRGTTTRILEIQGTLMTNDSGETTTTGSSDNEIVTSVSGLLKLAGCNIYGRMYRVGRIIMELSSPCLECRCTEVGVQCKQLEC